MNGNDFEMRQRTNSKGLTVREIDASPLLTEPLGVLLRAPQGRVIEESRILGA